MSCQQFAHSVGTRYITKEDEKPAFLKAIYYHRLDLRDDEEGV